MPLSHLFKAVEITAEMVRRRDFVRTIYGDSYAEKTRLPREIILVAARLGKKTNMQAALEICEEALSSGNGSAINPVIAALVDLCEAKTEKPKCPAI